jgi:hypothetical protein
MPVFTRSACNTHPVPLEGEVKTGRGNVYVTGNNRVAVNGVHHSQFARAIEDARQHTRSGLRQMEHDKY